MPSWSNAWLDSIVVTYEERSVNMITSVGWFCWWCMVGFKREEGLGEHNGQER